MGRQYWWWWWWCWCWGQAGGLRASARGGNAPSLPRVHCRELTLVLLDSWGDSHFVGLSGLQVVGRDGRPVHLAREQLWADPPDLNAFPGHSGESVAASCLPCCCCCRCSHHHHNHMHAQLSV